MFDAQLKEDETTIVSIIREYHSHLYPMKTGVASHVPRMSDIKAVLFDVYGTLIISDSGDVGSASDISNAQIFDKAFADAGFALGKTSGYQVAETFADAIRFSHHHSKLKGIEYPEIEIRTIWERVLSELEISKSSIQEAAVELAVRHECLSNPTSPMEGAHDIVNTLIQQNFVIGIVSNAQFYTQYLFPAYFLRSLGSMGFSDPACAWSYKYGFAKPSPQLFEAPLEYLRNQYGIEPAQTLYVGNDMLNDVWTAQENGCKAALFAGDKRSLRLRTGHPMVDSTEPDAVINELCQLVEMLR